MLLLESGREASRANLPRATGQKQMAEERTPDGGLGADDSNPAVLETVEMEFSVELDFDHRAYPLLLIEDDAEVRRRFKDDFGSTLTIHEVGSEEEARSWLDRQDYAAVIADLELADGSGARLLGELAELKPFTLRIILTEQRDQESLLRAINQARAYAYVTRPWVVAELTMTLRRAVERYALDAQNRSLLAELRKERGELADLVEERTGALREANERLHKLAVSDGLTGLFNHRYFQERLRHEVGVAKRYGSPLSLMLLDVDHFKTYNDTLGHPQGDILIREISGLITGTVREVDLVARYGGDEFVVAMPQAEKGSAVILAERIRRVIAGGHFEHVESLPEGQVTVSIGVATFPQDGDGPIELLTSADQALYRAKRNGRDQVELADGFDAATEPADRDSDFQLIVAEDGRTHDLTPRPGELKTLQGLLNASDPMDEILEDGETMEHPASVPNLAPDPRRLTADVIPED